MESILKTLEWAKLDFDDGELGDPPIHPVSSEADLKS